MKDSRKSELPRLTRFVTDKRRFFAGQGLTCAAATVLVLALAAILADVYLEFSVSVRWLVWGTMLSAGALLVWRLWLSRSRRFGEVAAVREIEHSHGELGQLLRTSHQFADDPEHPTPDGISRALAAVVRQQAHDALEHTPLDGLIPWRMVVRWGGVLALAVFIIAGLSITWRDFRVGAGRIFLPAAGLTYTVLDVSVSPIEFERGEEVVVDVRTSGREPEEVVLEISLDGTTWEPRGKLIREGDFDTMCLSDMDQSFDCRVAGGDAVSPPVHVTFVDPPVVEEIQVTIASPSYTGLPPREASPEKIRAVDGSQVTIEFRLNHGLAEGTISQFGGVSAPVMTDSPLIRYIHDVEVGHSRFVMRGKDANGWVLEPVLWNIQGIPDRSPSIAIADPEEDPEVTRITEVPVRTVFRDDYGLAEIQLVLTVEGKEKTIARQQFDAPGVRRDSLEAVVRLEDYDVDVGSSVRLHAVAKDFCPDHTAKTVSDVRMIVIRPFRLIVRPKNAPQQQNESNPEETKQQLEELKKAIAEQKRVVAETLQRREEETSPQREQKTQELAQREQQLQEQVAQIEPQTDASNQAPEEQEKTSLQRAAQELLQATEALRKPDLKESLKKEDQALAAMMQAQSELEQKLQEQQQQQQQNASSSQQQQQQQRPPEPMESLAERARELARQEALLQERLNQFTQESDQSDKSDKSDQTAASQSSQESDQSDQSDQSDHSPTSPTMQELQQKQGQLAGEGRQLQNDLAAHPETTQLANERMREAAQTMEQAAEELQRDDVQQAANQMQTAEKQLERLAEHLEGLNPEQVAQTLEKARDKTQQAAQTLRPDMPQQSATQQPPPQQSQSQPSQQPPQNQQQSQQQSQSSQNQLSPQKESHSQQSQSQQQSQPQQMSQMSPQQPHSREEATEDARTVDDWMERLAASEDAGDPRMRKRLDEARKDLETEAMADRITQAEADRMRGNEKRADDTDRKTSSQLKELSDRLEQERKNAVQTYMQQLAQAETEAKALQQQLLKDPTNQPAGKGRLSTSERLEQLAEDLDDLNDNKLEDVAQDIRKDIGPFNRNGSKQAGALIPESISKTSLPPVVKRLRDLIEEAIQREYLLGRDQRIPEKYSNIVESYFKALSDDAEQ